MRDHLDMQDKRLVAALAQDGAQSPGTLAERLGVTAPTVRTRIKNLMRKGVLAIAGLVDPEKTPGLTVALVCLTLDAHDKLDATLEAIARMDKVHWAGVVTGRYDIMVEVVLSDEIADLYRFLDKDLSKIGHIATSESFVVMKSRKKWLRLPEGASARFLENDR